MISGPHLNNFIFIRDLFIKNNALTIVKSAKELSQAVLSYLNDPNKVQTLGRQAKTIFQQHQGVLQQYLSAIDALL